MEVPKTPSFRLDGRRALVTGAGRGIGLAAAAAGRTASESWAAAAPLRIITACSASRGGVSSSTRRTRSAARLFFASWRATHQTRTACSCGRRLSAPSSKISTRRDRTTWRRAAGATTRAATGVAGSPTVAAPRGWGGGCMGPWGGCMVPHRCLTRSRRRISTRPRYG